MIPRLLVVSVLFAFPVRTGWAVPPPIPDRLAVQVSDYRTLAEQVADHLTPDATHARAGRVFLERADAYLQLWQRQSVDGEFQHLAEQLPPELLFQTVLSGLKNSIRRSVRVSGDPRRVLVVDTASGSVRPGGNPVWNLADQSYQEVTDASGTVGRLISRSDRVSVLSREVAEDLWDVIVRARSEGGISEWVLTIPQDVTPALILPSGKEILLATGSAWAEEIRKAPQAALGHYRIGEDTFLVPNPRQEALVPSERDGQGIHFRKDLGEERTVQTWRLLLTRTTPDAADALASRLNRKPRLIVDLRDEQVRAAPMLSDRSPWLITESITGEP